MNNAQRFYCPVRSFPNPLHFVFCSWWVPVHTLRNIIMANCLLPSYLALLFMFRTVYLDFDSLTSCFSNCHPQKLMKVSVNLGLTSVSLLQEILSWIFWKEYISSFTAWIQIPPADYIKDNHSFFPQLGEKMGAYHLKLIFLNWKFYLNLRKKVTYRWFLPWVPPESNHMAHFIWKSDVFLYHLIFLCFKTD